jgi:hypothetical protein
MKRDSSTLSATKPVGLMLGEQRQEWGAAPPSDDRKPVDKNTPKCGGCGRHHTEPGITHESAEIGCLRRTVKRQGEEIASLKVEVEVLRARLESSRLGPTEAA